MAIQSVDAENALQGVQDDPDAFQQATQDNQIEFADAQHSTSVAGARDEDVNLGNQGTGLFITIQHQADGLVHDARSDQVDPVRVLGQIAGLRAQVVNIDNLGPEYTDALQHQLDGVQHDVALRADYDQIRAGLDTLEADVRNPNHDARQAELALVGVGAFLDAPNRLTPEQQNAVRDRILGIHNLQAGINMIQMPALPVPTLPAQDFSSILAGFTYGSFG